MRLLHLTCAALALLPLAACSSSIHSDGKAQPRLAYQYREPVYLNVAAIEVQDMSKADGNSEFVPFVESVGDTLKGYLGGRFEAIGGAETLSFVIEDKRLTHSFKESGYSVGKFLGVDGQDVYKIDVTVQATLRDDYGNERGKRFHLWRELSISEHDSVAEREKKQLEGLEALMGSLDASLLESFRTQFNIVRLSTPELR